MVSRLKAVGLRIGAPVFAAAGLVLAIEPMLGKLLLPALGGSPATWAACLWAFQLLLLVGYGYAHLSTRYLDVRRQVIVHLTLLALAVALLFEARLGAPIRLAALPPALAVAHAVLERVGVPFVVLASTAPLLSRWSRAVGRSGRAIYAIANAGALLGLLAYPLILERFIALPAQLALWSAGFVLFGLALLPVSVAALSAPAPRVVSRAKSTPSRTLYCLFCAFLPSALLIAVTNHVTVDLAATPVIWVVPLALYLCSFVVVFTWRARWVRLVALVMWLIGAAGLALDAYRQGAGPLAAQLAVAMLALFGAALLAHSELAREHPQTGEDSGFYLILAAGAALGGAFVAGLAPLVFSDFYELELCAMALLLLLLMRASREPRLFRALVYVGSGVCLPLLAADLVVRRATTARDGSIVERRRGFSGTLKVVDVGAGRMLQHGLTRHGLQLRDPALRREPTTYYARDTAVGRVLSQFRKERPRRLGVVGLGVGTLAAYGKPRDSLRFYEVDPNVVALARRDFSFIRDSAASVEVAMGDGRISLAQEAPRAFDVLVLDAFSSDSVPVHLLTREAFEVYLRQLAPEGMLLANVSNRHLALERVVRGAARAVGLHVRVEETRPGSGTHASHAVWAVMSRDEAQVSAFVGAEVARGSEADVTWTDGRASLLSVLR
ncbi:MAG: spermidine synthase [Polyangiaceae bacterium]|jgi:hypothetical protein|nr:spermidine synthase [Polyangiaceae bacterium]